MHSSKTKKPSSCFCGITVKRIITILLCVGISGCNHNPAVNQPAIDIGTDENVIWAISPQYDLAEEFKNGIALVVSGDKRLFINKAGLEMLDGEWEPASGFHNGVATVKHNQEYQYLFRNGWLMDRPFSDIHRPIISNDPLVLSKNEAGLYGYLNLQDLWYIEPEFLDGEPFSDGISVVCNEYTQKQFLLTENGEQIEVDIRYYINNIADGFATANSSQYISTKSGKIAFEGRYEDAKAFSEGLAAVKQNGKYGYIDESGKIVIQPRFQSAGLFSNGVAVVEQMSGDYILINQKGKQVVSFPHNCLVGQVYGDTVVVREKGGKDGLMNAMGEWVVKPEYESIVWSDYGFFHLFQGSIIGSSRSVGLYDPKTGLLIHPGYDYIYPISDSILVAEKNHKVEILDRTNGKKLLEAYYEWDREFGEGLICVRDPATNLYGYIDYYGEWIIYPQFTLARSFNEGLACVKMDGKYGYIANPLYYSSWTTSDEFRGVCLGIDLEFLREDVVTVGEFAAALECVVDRVFPIDVDLSAYTASNQPLTRGSAAILIDACASKCGEETRFYCAMLKDLSTLDIELQKSISYVASLGLFDLDPLTGNFEPNKTLSQSEAKAIAVRVAEYFLDWDRRENPDRITSHL